MGDINKSAENSFALTDGSRVAVMGAGAAGSMFSYFLLQFADRLGIEIELDIYEPKDFSDRGPKGCNRCGGIISESLVQSLATEGINLPSSVVQRGIEAYVLHTDAGTVRIETPIGEKRIAAVHRGGGPLKGPESTWESFDGFLLDLALKKGAKLVNEAITDVEWLEAHPHVTSESIKQSRYDLVVVAAGVNSALKFFERVQPNYRAPHQTRTMIREYSLPDGQVHKYLGDAMHLFLVNVPRLEFAAVIPKGETATMCMLGENIDKALLDSFLAHRSIGECLPDSPNDCQVCGCSPYMALSAAKKPYADRVVFIGDCGVSRLYKDGIGAAYRTAKAAAATAALQGVSAQHFAGVYQTACRAIINDNRYGHIVFFVTKLIQKSRVAQRGVLRMVEREQAAPNQPQRMSTILWDTFTGSAPYREIFYRTLHPAYIVSLCGNLLAALFSGNTTVPTTTKPQEAN